MDYCSEDTNRLLAFRKGIVTDCVRQNRKPARIPLLSNAWTWKICDAGMMLSQALYDTKMLYRAVCEHHEKYDFDMYIDLCTRNPVNFIDALGDNIYKVDDERNQISFCFTYPMKEDEYPLLLKKGVKKFIFEDLLPRKYAWNTKQEACKHLKKSISEYHTFREYTQNINNTFIEKYGVCRFNLAKPILPSDVLFTSLRGVRGCSIDLNRNKKYIEDTLCLIDEYYSKAPNEMLRNYDKDDNVYFPFRITSMSHNVMNPTQYEKYNWPYLKKMVEQIDKAGAICLIFTEGSIAHLTDFFKDLPKGRVALLLEMDDPREMKKRLPNLTIVGGYPVKFLGEASQQECIDEAKRLIDDMAYDGNYILSCNKMLSYPDDARSENLLAVNNFVREYAVF